MKTNSFENGLSDHTIVKIKFEKFEPKKLIYRNFKQYNSDQFKLDISNIISTMRPHTAFKYSFVSTLDKHVPMKAKVLRGNKNPILTRIFGSN